MQQEYDILIIDDEQVIIDSVVKAASLENFSIDSAASADLAIKKISQIHYNLIFCDIMMPGMDGFQFLREVENLKINSPVMITTGYSTVENAVKSLYTGAVGFIPKPFTLDEIISMMHRGLRYNKLMKEAREQSSGIVFVSCPARYFRLGYSSWLNIDTDGTVLLGITDLYMQTIDTVTKIEFVESDEHLTQGMICVRLYTQENLIHQVYSAASGRVIARNERLISDPALLEKDPFFEGWLFRIIPSDLDNEIKSLISCSSDRI